MVRHSQKGYYCVIWKRPQDRSEVMQASAAAIIELARDPGYVGGTVAVLAVLHTWTQQLNQNPQT